jgi:hypothetical protein
MAKPGPNKGHGGAPRKAEGSVSTRADGYKRVTVGAKGKGEQVYAHRAKAYGGVPPKGSKAKGTVVHHKNRRRGDNRSGNLSKVSKAENNKR